MEELQSTEILDREILEDARKKAHRILKAADDTIKVKKAEWEKKTAAALSETEQKFAQNIQKSNEIRAASMPLEKRRIKAKKNEELINSAVQAWYNGLSKRQILDIIKLELEKRLAFCENLAGGGEARILIHKIEKPEAEALLKEALPDMPFKIETAQSQEPYPELILENSKLKIYASIDKAVQHILSVKRAELAAALLGEEGELSC